MRTALHTLAVVLAAFVLGGCTSVTITQPLGTPLPAEEHDAFEGSWQLGSAVIHAKAAQGPELKLAMVQWEDGKGWKLVETTAVLTEHDGSRFLNVRDAEAPKESPRYFFLRYVAPEDDTRVLYGPNVETFAAAVEGGRLKGKVEEGENTKHVRLSSRAEELQAFIGREKLADQFDIDSPMLLRRVGKP